MLNSVLHVFTDASVLAFAAVIYLAIETNSEFVSSVGTFKTKGGPVERCFLAPVRAFYRGSHRCNTY